MVSWARPGKGAGQCEEEGPWRAAKQPRQPKAPLWDEKQCEAPTRGEGLEGGGMPRAKRALATLGEGAGGGGAS